MESQKETKIRPYDKLDDEPDWAFAHFRNWLRIPPPRGLKKSCGTLGITPATIYVLSSTYKWRNRAAAFDIDFYQREIDAVMDEAEKRVRNQLNRWATVAELAEFGFDRMADAELDERGPEHLTVRELLAMLDKATYYERLILGEATERSEVLSRWDLSKLSIEELETLQALEKKATEK